MNIVMLTNTYLPHVGGVAHSVSSFSDSLREAGHDVRIIAPQFEGALESTDQILRVPAVQNFNGSDFSLTIPQPGLVGSFLDQVRPDLLHSHHPFLLGDTALRAGWTRRIPVVFTHHTRYEQYTHYVPLDSEALQRVTIQMVTEYANLCTHVIAPSQSIADLLVKRCVTTPVSVIPTGIDLQRFGGGDGNRFRQAHGIPADGLLVGHVGRLAEEKNLAFLAQAVGQFLAERPEAVFAVVGSGECQAAIQNTVADIAGSERIVMTGCLQGEALIDAYAALDVFVFSSQSETQGMVLAEAMAARCCVLALDGPGVREVVTPASGRMLPADALAGEFAAALAQLTQDRDALRGLGASAQKAAREFSMETCAGRLVELYQRLIAEYANRDNPDPAPWDQLLRRLEIEWSLIVEKSNALRAAVAVTPAVHAEFEESATPR